MFSLRMRSGRASVSSLRAKRVKLPPPPLIINIPGELEYRTPGLHYLFASSSSSSYHEQRINPSEFAAPSPTSDRIFPSRRERASHWQSTVRGARCREAHHRCEGRFRSFILAIETNFGFYLYHLHRYRVSEFRLQMQLAMRRGPLRDPPKFRAARRGHPKLGFKWDFEV